MSRRGSLLLVIALALAASAGCDASGTDAELRRAPLIYGADDRREVYEVSADDRLGAMARSSLLAIGRTREIQAVDPAGGGGALMRVTSPSVGDFQGLCPGERFAAEPAFALCSAFPIAPHLALTAGHCLDVVPTNELSVLTGFYESAPDVVAPLAATQVHTIEEVMVRDASRDVALLRLGGVALTPLALASAPPLFGDAVSAIDHGMGAPAKIVTGGQAFEVDENAFVTDLDAFGGSSGAPVFDEAGLVVGLLTSGSFDYDDTETGCRKARHESAGSLAANESVEQARPTLDDLCRSRFVPEVCEGAGPEPAEGCTVVPPARGNGRGIGTGLFVVAVAFGARRKARRR